MLLHWIKPKLKGGLGHVCPSRTKRFVSTKYQTQESSFYIKQILSVLDAAVVCQEMTMMMRGAEGSLPPFHCPQHLLQQLTCQDPGGAGWLVGGGLDRPE